MYDISHKSKSLRIATAQAVVTMQERTIVSLRDGRVPKGDPIPVARVAAIQAAKQTASVIPYCHPVPIDHVDVAFIIGERSISISVTVKAIYKTGIEMETLHAASAAALTVYDMLKMLDNTMEITSVKLVHKEGGKSDYTTHYDRPLRVAVLVMSDTIAAGKKEDYSGRMIEERLKKEGLESVSYDVIPDDPDLIERMLIGYADEMNVDLVLTTGGTGFSPRDNSPEATRRVIEREVPGITEMLRAYGQQRTPYSMLSRGVAGLRGNTIIINLPGSRRGVSESLDALFPALLHSFKMLRGGGHPQSVSSDESRVSNN